MEREDGFIEELKSQFPGIQMVGLQFGMADRAKAMAVTENMITAHPDLAGLFADNESSLSGAVQALKSRGAKGIKLVGFDASDALIADLKDGWIDALILQDPYRMGYDSVRAITRKIQGETPSPRLDLPATLATRAGLEAGAVAKQLLPGFVAVGGAH
jgi:ribose transport system substrate-binding protein